MCLVLCTTVMQKYFFVVEKCTCFLISFWLKKEKEREKGEIAPL
jgi:hypothetical protein